MGSEDSQAGGGVNSPEGPRASSPSIPPIAYASGSDLKKIILVTGKGGVGKTTVAAGLAEALASRPGGSVLVEFTDGEAGRRVLASSDAYRRGTLRHEVVAPEKALEDLSAGLFSSAILGKVVTGNFAMKRLLRAAPGLRELASLEAIRKLRESYAPAHVVVDMPATGHGIAWLRVPFQLDGLLIAGPLHGVARRLREDVISPAKCSVVVVTLAEQMVLQETLELCASIADEIGLGAPRLVVNRIPPPLPPSALRDVQALRSEATGNVSLETAAADLEHTIAFRRDARRKAMRLLATARSDGSPTTLPLEATDPSTADVGTWLIQEGLLGARQ